MRTKAIPLSVFLCSALLTLFVSRSAGAATYYWDTDGTTPGFGTASGTWGTDAYWGTDSTGASATANPITTTSDSINFGSATVGLAAGNVAQATYSTKNVGSITFASTSGAITIGTGSANSQTINIANGGTIQVDNASDGIGTVLTGVDIIKAGTGVLNLSGAAGVATYSGTLTIANGTLQSGKNNVLPMASIVNFGAVATSGILDLGGYNQQLAGFGLGSGHAAWTSGDLIGNSSTTADSTLTFAGISTFGGVIQNVLGSGTRKTLLTVKSGVLTLSGANTYTGATAINPASTLKVDVGAGGALGATPVTINSTGTLNYDNTTSSGAQNAAMNSSVAVAGEGTLQLTRTALKTFSLTLGSLAALPAGGALTFVYGGTPGTIGVDSKIAITGQAAGFINSGTFFNGTTYAAYDAGGFVRAFNYNTDAGAEIITSSQAAFTAGKQYEQITGSGEITSQGSQAITTLNLDNANSLTLAGGATLGVNGILKTGNAAGGTISGGTGLQPASNAGLVIRTDQAGDTLTISTPILANGANTLTKSGVGTLTLSGSNTYTGQTFINNGTLSISANNNLGAVATGAQLNMNGATLQATASFALDNAGSKIRAIVLANANTIGVTSANNLTVSGVISGSGSLTKADTGTLTLGGVNTFTGGLNVNGGIVQFAGAGQLPNVSAATGGGIYINNGATIIVTNSTALGQGYSGSQPVLTLSNGTLQTSGTVNLSPVSGSMNIMLSGTSGTFNVTSGTTSYQANNSYSHNIQGTGSLTKTGAGTLVLHSNSQNNGWLGSTYINGGILQLGVLGGNQGIPNSSAVIVNGGTLDITSNNTTVAAVTLAGGGSITGTSGILTGSSYNMQDGTVSVKLAGGATVTLTKSTGGTVTLSNTNTYSGATVISAGTLALGANGSISNTPSISIAAGATNDVSAIAAYTLSGNTALSASGTSAAAAVLKGGTTVDLGTRPVSLAFTPTTFTGDSTHPALVVAQGGLTLNGQVTVINNGASPLGAGTYTLLSQASGSISGTPTLNAVIGGQGMDPMGTATLSVSGGNLNMIVSVPAYSFSWINSASGDWSGANWLDNLGATAGPAAGGRTNYWLNFNQADTYTANNDFGTLLLNRINFGGASVTLTGNSLTFTNGGVVGPMINQNSSVSVTVSNSLALNNNLTLGGSGGGLITLAGVVSGASSLTKTSPGMLMLSANNTFTGQTYLNNGTMVISTNSALGAITTGATLNMSNATLQTTATLALDNAGANKRNVVLAGTNVFDTGANALTISGTVSGTGGGLTKTGAGTMTLSVNATYTGPTTVNQGTLSVQGLSSSRMSIASGATVSAGNGNLPVLVVSGTMSCIWPNSLAGGASSVTLTNGTLTGPGAFANPPFTTSYLGAPTITANGAANMLTCTNGGVGGNAPGCIKIDSSYPLTLNTPLASDALSVLAPILSSTTTGGVLVKTGLGTVTLSAASSYGGGTTVGGGVIAVGNNTALGSGLVTLSGGSLAASASCSLSNVINLAGNATLNTAGYYMTLSGTITNSGAITKIGAGTLKLSGVNTYTNATTVSEGTLEVGSANALGIGTRLMIATNAFVMLSADTTVNALYFGTNVQFRGTWGALNKTGVRNKSELFTGAGVLTVLAGPKPPDGTLIRFY